MFFHGFVASKIRKGRSEKRGGAKDRLPKMSTKFAPRLRARAIRKSKLLKTGGVGALFELELDKIWTTPARDRFGSQNRQKLACSEQFWKLSSKKFAPRLRARAIRKSKSLTTGMFGVVLEVELDKICATPARESDSEVKIVKTWQVRSTFGS